MKENDLQKVRLTSSAKASEVKKADTTSVLKADTTSAGSTSELDAGLRAVAEDDERLGTSSGVSMRLLAEVQAIGAARRRKLSLLSLGAAAAVLLAILVPVWRSLGTPDGTPEGVPYESQPGAPEGAPYVNGVPIVTRELVTEFFPLTYSNVPVRGGYVVRMQVPRSALASFGAALASESNGSANVLADVVVGDDGLARAVRFVQVIKDQEQTP